MASVLAPEGNISGKNAHLSLEVILASRYLSVQPLLPGKSSVRGGGLGQTLSDPKSHRKSQTFNKFLSSTRSSSAPHLQPA